MKFVDTKVVFREVPDEITLAINISNCPVHCPGCHSSYLAQDIGELLTEDKLNRFINENAGISCVSFMGGDAEPETVGKFCRWIRVNHPGLKTCWYSGRDIEHARANLPYLDYVKVGPFIEEFGPLDSPTTNQRFYTVSHDTGEPLLVDRTRCFLSRFI